MSNPDSKTNSSNPPPPTLQVLCCTANMGNAKPTARDIAAWIPPGGTLPTNTETAKTAAPLDVIVIGMQEATWKAKKNKKTGEDNNNDDDNTSDNSEDEEEEANDAAPSTTTTTTTTKKTMLKQGSSNLSVGASAAATTDTTHLRSLIQDNLGESYKLLKEVLRGQMRLYLYVKQEWVDKIKDLEGERRMLCFDAGSWNVCCHA